MHSSKLKKKVFTPGHRLSSLAMLDQIKPSRPIKSGHGGISISPLMIQNSLMIGHLPFGLGEKKV